MPLKPAHHLAAELADGKLTSRQLTEQCLAQIFRTNSEVNSFITVMKEEALAAADAADARRAAGKTLSPLDGIPVAIKDNIITKGVRTTCASKMLGNFVPPYDSTVVRKLREAGLVLIGKTNLDEFAMGSSCEHSHFGAASNPWDTNTVPGGSSGGSAVAVAAGQAPLSLGSDTGGSIRQPASLCGIVGMKPTYGRVSRYGLVAFASSLDQIGPMALDVRDSAQLLSIIGGHDPHDSTSADLPAEDFTQGLEEGDLKGLRIARPREFFDVEGMDPDVTAATNAALEKAANAGAEIVDVSMPHSKYSVACYYIIATAEASSNLARYDGAQYGYRAEGAKNIVEMFSRSRSEGFGDEVKLRIMIGTHALSAGYYDAYYLRAQKVRTLIKRDYDAALEKADIIAAPASPFPAFPRGEKMNDPLAMYLCDIFTLSLNLAGYCGLSLPAGFSPQGLPIGLQLLGGAFQEKKLLQSAWQMEQLLGVVGTRAPKLVEAT